MEIIIIIIFKTRINLWLLLFFFSKPELTYKSFNSQSISTIFSSMLVHLKFPQRYCNSYWQDNAFWQCILKGDDQFCWFLSWSRISTNLFEFRDNKGIASRGATKVKLLGVMNIINTSVIVNLTAEEFASVAIITTFFLLDVTIFRFSFTLIAFSYCFIFHMQHNSLQCKIKFASLQGMFGIVVRAAIEKVTPKYVS